MALQRRKRIHFIDYFPDTSRLIHLLIGLLCVSLLVVSILSNRSIGKYNDLSEKNHQVLIIWNDIEYNTNRLLSEDGVSLDAKYSSIIGDLNDIEVIIELSLKSDDLRAIVQKNNIGEIVSRLDAFEYSVTEFYLGYMENGIRDVASFSSLIEKNSSLENLILKNHGIISRDLNGIIGRYNALRTISSVILIATILLYLLYLNSKQKRIYQIISDNSRFMRENPDPVLRVSYDMRITNANSAAQPLLRKWNSGIGEGVPAEVEDVFRASIREKSKKILEEQVGFKTYQIAVVYIYDTEYLNLYASDISELKKIQDEVQQQQKLEALGLLAGGVAHDFNNLLTGIMNASQLIQNTVNSREEEVIDYTEMIIEASEHAADLTKKLLDFSRTDKVHLRPIDLNAIILSTITILERTLDKKIKIQYFNEANDLKVLADRGGIQRIFLNMGINSSHAMPNGGTLIFRVQRVYLDEIYCKLNNHGISPGEYCKIEVEDTGVGIHSDNLSKIFDPFYTTKEFGKGTGLGLSSAYGVIKQHNGFIHVYSEEYVGTVFHIYIPCIEDMGIDLKYEELVMGSGRILLIDDEYLVRVTTEALLVSLGYKVVTACNGMEGIDIFQNSNEKFDLVIVDMIMPGLTGREVAQEIKGMDGDCRILLSSGFSKDEDYSIREDENLSGFLKKPYRDIKISKTVYEIIHGPRERDNRVDEVPTEG